jgi:hypothetical protein
LLVRFRQFRPPNDGAIGSDLEQILERGVLCGARIEQNKTTVTTGQRQHLKHRHSKRLTTDDAASGLLTNDELTTFNAVSVARHHRGPNGIPGPKFAKGSRSRSRI